MSATDGQRATALGDSQPTHTKFNYGFQRKTFGIKGKDQERSRIISHANSLFYSEHC